MQGFLLLNKPNNMTSYGAVARIKRLSGEKRVGHTGTLDPMATGVLPIFLGRATALSSYLIEADKTYIAEIKLGITTDTCDITGEVLNESKVSVTDDELLEVLNSFLGESMQTPPMFSALKKDGVRLYDLARKGITVDIPKRSINIKSVKLLEKINSKNIFKIEVTVSKGTYIRSLARDIGEKFLCGATLFSLIRSETCGFNIGECVNLEDLTEDNIKSFIKSEERAIEYIPELFVTEPQAVRFSNGGQLSFERLSKNNFKENELYRIKYKDKFIGIGYADTDNSQIAVKCVINNF